MRETPASPALATACYLHATAPGPAFQNIQLSLNIGESCPVEHLHEAWQRVAAARGVLRSSFSKAATGEILRRENDTAPIAWTSLDWRNVPPTEIPGRWHALLEEDARHPFDLTAPPLIRFQAIELPGGHCHQLLTFPKLLLDEDALFHILCEWLEALEGHPLQEEGSTEPVPGATPAVSDWWMRFFTRAANPLIFETYPRPATPAENNQRQENSCLLDRETSRDFKALCQRLNLPPRHAFLAIWSLVLSRLTFSDNALLLAPSGLTTPENLLPCLLPVDNTASGESWLREVAQNEKDRSENAAIGLERTLLLADPKRKLSDFPSAFSWAPPLLNDRIHDVFPRWINFDAKIVTHSQFPLTLQVRDGNRFFLQVEFDPAICPSAEASALLERVVLTLGAILENPSQKIGQLNVLTQAERHALNLAKPSLASTQPAPPVEKAVAAMADHQPDSLAITGPNEAALSFAELDSHSRSLATWLRNENVADGWNIAVCLTPTPWLPVAILGILRAGDTCVPLDPLSSPEWLAGRIETSDVEMIVCDSGTAPFFDGSTRRLLILDQQWETVAASTGGAEPTAQKNAFLLNGTEIDPAPSLRSFPPDFIAAACQESINLWSLAAGDRIPLLSAAGTGAFAETLLCSLISGATLVLPDENDPLSVVEEGITHLRLSTAQWRVLIARFHRNKQPLPQSLRTVCVETDSDFSHAHASWQMLNEGRVQDIFFYSPAGLCGAAIRLLPSHKTEASPGHIPVGFPGPGVTASLLDPAGQPLPPHYPGRLEISFTHNGSEKFPLPAWRDRSGAIHYMPSEHAALRQAFSELPGVLDVHCASVQTGGRSETAVWTIMQEVTAQISPETSRNATQHLPSYLRPGFVLSVPEFPLTSSGHIHQGKLPFPSVAAAASPAQEKTYESPRIPAKDWEPLVLLHKNPEAPVLFLVHDLDGNPEKYKSLANLLQGDWTLYGTTARGLHNPSACHLTVETEAAALVEAICLLDPDGPFHLFGYGYGAVLAMEMARQLRIAGRQVPYLALTGSRPPENENRGDWRKTLTRVFSFGSSKTATPPPPSTPVATAHLTALQDYHGRPLDGPAGIILGTDMGRDVEAAWMECAPEAFIETISCPTAQMLTEPPVKRLAVIMREWAVASGEEQ